MHHCCWLRRSSSTANRQSKIPRKRILLRRIDVSKELKDGAVYFVLVFHGICQSEAFRVRDQGVSISMANNEVGPDRWDNRSYRQFA